MQDMTLRGTGNSRFLKSVENFKTLFPTYDDFAAALVSGTLPVDFNGINREGILRAGTPINTLTLLQNETAAMLGLGSDAVPNDAFEFVGKYNLHWWSVLLGVTKGYYEPVMSPAVGATLGATDDIYGMGGNFVKGYSTELEVSADGKVDLKNIQSIGFTKSPNSLSDCQDFANAILTHAPCYIKVVDVVGEVSIHYIPEGATYLGQSSLDPEGNSTLIGYANPDYGDGPTYSLNINGASYAAIPASTVTGATYIEGNPGDVVYKHSANRNAYPDSGTVDGETYTYLGIPFEKLPFAGRVEIGSYTGTSTYGASNKNSLTFSFTPKMVIVRSYATNEAAYCAVLMNDPVYGQKGLVLGNNTHWLDVSWDDRTVNWYSTSAPSQLNMKSPYLYFAIG